MSIATNRKAIQKVEGGFSKLSDEGLSPFIHNGKRD